MLFPIFKCWSTIQQCCAFLQGLKCWFGVGGCEIFKRYMSDVGIYWIGGSGTEKSYAVCIISRIPLSCLRQHMHKFMSKLWLKSMVTLKPKVRDAETVTVKRQAIAVWDFFFFFPPAYSRCIWFPNTALSALAVVCLGIFSPLVQEVQYCYRKIR